jgi:8-oxo-dGTP diphosphatase
MIHCPNCNSTINPDYVREDRSCVVCWSHIPDSEFGKTADSSELNEDCSNYDTRAYVNPGLTADVIPLRWNRSKRELECHLIRRKYRPFDGMWAFAGGFYDKRHDSCLLDIAAREAFEETGLEDLDLIQLKSFGSKARDPRQFTVTVPFMAMVPDMEEVEAVAGDDADEVEWFPLSALPEMAFDHAEILAHAVTVLKASFLAGDKAVLGLLRRKASAEPTATLSEIAALLEYLGIAKVSVTGNVRSWLNGRYEIKPHNRVLLQRGRPAAIFELS